ncbi:MAG: M14 family zinc carboxypeptidase, partial [Bacteroidota bacterium]
RADFPGLITEKASIGTTGEGRAIWMVEISNAPGVDEGEPEVLYTAIHHAREPQSMTTVLYYMIYLLENYGTDPEVTYLVDNRRLTFVPVLNPDGYVYNEEEDPNGGGLWRKNRRDNGDGSFGVDPNRNYGYEWARDDTGSSPMGSSETYRGPAPFSDPETASLRDFVESRDFRLAFNYHSFSDVLIHPWGYEVNALTPDSSRYSSYAALMTEANGYPSGTTGQMLGYVVNGKSDDWFYGEQTTKDKIYAFTPEVGTRADFFWPMPDRIEPLARMNLDANNKLAWLAGGFPAASLASATDRKLACDALQCGNDYIDPGEVMEVTIDFENIGLGPLSGATYRLVSDNPNLIPPSETGPIALAAGGVTSDTLDVQVRPETPLGIEGGLVVEIDIAGAVFTFPLDPVLIGTELPLFEDEASTLTNWSLAGNTAWRVTTDGDAGSVFTESPDGFYGLDATATLILDEPLDLRGVSRPILSFDTRWDIEPDYDGGQVLLSSNGRPFVALKGVYTTPGADTGDFGIQEVGAPYYDGTRSTWVREHISLSNYAGFAGLTIAFQFQSDDFIVADGWYVDNIRVSELVSIFDVDAEAQPEAMELSIGALYPNPTAGDLVVDFALPATGATVVEVFDLLGRRVAVLADGELLAGSHRLTWDGRSAHGRSLSAGTYVLRLAADGRVLTRRFVRIGG